MTSGIPTVASDGLGAGSELEASWGNATRVWWAIAWRSALAVPVGAAVGCVVGSIVGAVGAAMHLDMAQIRLLAQVITFPIGLALGVPIAIWATRLVLRKRFKNFRIALLPH